MSIVQMSLSAGVLIMVIVVVRAGTLDKLPKKTFLFLWGVVVARLLLPVSVPARCSVYAVMGPLPGWVAQAAAWTGAVPAANPLSSASLPGPGHVAATGMPLSSLSPMEVVWLLGLAAGALFFIMTYYKCRQEFATSLPVENDFVKQWLRQHPLRRSVQIRYGGQTTTPLTYGVFRPVILLPKTTDWTDEAGLELILTHEWIHIRRGDTLTKILLAFVLCLHWFNPLVWVMYVLAHRDIELACDEAVIKTLGKKVKAKYALTLLGTAETRRRLVLLHNSLGQNPVEERIRLLTKVNKMPPAGIILALALMIGIPAVFATSPYPVRTAPLADVDAHYMETTTDQVGKAVVCISGQEPLEGVIATVVVRDQASGRSPIPAEKPPHGEAAGSNPAAYTTWTGMTLLIGERQDQAPVGQTERSPSPPQNLVIYKTEESVHHSPSPSHYTDGVPGTSWSTENNEIYQVALPAAAKPALKTVTVSSGRDAIESQYLIETASGQMRITEDRFDQEADGYSTASSR